jgi:hypothetical protein
VWVDQTGENRIKHHTHSGRYQPVFTREKQNFSFRKREQHQPLTLPYFFLTFLTFQGIPEGFKLPLGANFRIFKGSREA